MKADKNQEELSISILEIKLAIQKAINVYCKDNPDTTYLEVNKAIVDIISSNLGYELKKFCSDV